MHRYGYGYNTPTDVFSEESLSANPHYRVLLEGFVQACNRILDRREGYAQKTGYRINHVQAWIRVQTPEERSFPWHHHVPATLSGCYFVTVPGPLPDGEGDLMFQDSAPGSIFKPAYTSVRPREGDLIIFPSHLLHMPTPSPGARDWRIGVNMDAYVEWSR